MVRVCVFVICLLSAVRSDAAIRHYGHTRGRKPCNIVYRTVYVQPAAPVATPTAHAQVCPDVHRSSGCPDGRCFPRRPAPSQPPSNPPPFDFPPDDEGDDSPDPSPPAPTPTPVSPLDRAHAIIMILSAVAGILAGFGVVKASDDPDDDPENEGLIKAVVSKVKEVI